MEAVHYSVMELEKMPGRVELKQQGHLKACEQCLYLHALVRRVQGDPSDEQREVTVDLLKRWV
jgi:hypothetical protein